MYGRCISGVLPAVSALCRPPTVVRVRRYVGPGSCFLQQNLQSRSIALDSVTGVMERIG